ncbi:hypothetical protein CYMTET_32621 [Cymbomonas tetramitiformis]|uniref:Uncharacterized protein n=1 Tax=Cymbomonas tetramitiformis TaxID=36881 RepID=A0AAE0FEP2_9CHLO|nr:hypothetical protein CYMTET_32621 [Cymbomonas tetramitiformis]
MKAERECCAARAQEKPSRSRCAETHCVARYPNPTSRSSQRCPPSPTPTHRNQVGVRGSRKKTGPACNALDLGNVREDSTRPARAQTPPLCVRRSSHVGDQDQAQSLAARNARYEVEAEVEAGAEAGAGAEAEAEAEVEADAQAEAEA